VVNTQLIELYWTIGKAILDRQNAEGWGTRVIDRLSADLRAAYPDMHGLSRSNIKYMRQMAAAWPESAIGLQAVGQLPWGHVRVLLDKIEEPAARDWYAREAVAGGWSRNVLLNQIKGRAHTRVGAAPSDFELTLAGEDSELAAQIAKDPYVYDFLGLSGRVAERDLEQALVDRLRDTLLELGTGFAFVGRQVHLDIDGDDFFIDLLFSNVPQVRYVVVELKVGKFQPEYAGKLPRRCGRSAGHARRVPRETQIQSAGSLNIASYGSWPLSGNRTVAGTPVATAPAGTSLTTTELAPICAPSPMCTGPRTRAPAPMMTLLPTVG
jgi:predicted nuclease of restriction endonuclease-like (RecB) superfamily